MNYMKNKSNRYIEIIFISLFILIIITWGVCQKRAYKLHGVYTIAKMIKWESEEQGSSSYLDVYYKNIVYKTVLNTMGLKEGSYYFVIILPDDPTFADVKKKVPDCFWISLFHIMVGKIFPNVMSKVIG